MDFIERSTVERPRDFLPTSLASKTATTELSPRHIRPPHLADGLQYATPGRNSLPPHTPRSISVAGMDDARVYAPVARLGRIDDQVRTVLPAKSAPSLTTPPSQYFLACITLRDLTARA
ncbi:hypothetical protein K523DRAFT_324732 [Schizophyllum commune Tattone D]|nr:hypothetical protein K523DRAFT_324732 [Schizophyllum commune Tattone D]